MFFNTKSFNYNIENLLEDYQKYISESKTYKLDDRNSFVYSSTVRISGGNDKEKSQNCSDGCKRAEENNINEEEMMVALYSEINGVIYPFVVIELDELGENQNPIYAEEGISRELLAQITDRVLERAAIGNDMPAEVGSEFDEEKIFVPWSRWMLLRAGVEAVTLNEIFARRRKNKARQM